MNEAVQQRLGARITAARLEASLTPAALAERVGMERTQLVRVEAGDRKVTVAELAGIATQLGVSIDWFVTDPPPAVLSRRSDGDSAHQSSRMLDLAIDRAARDVRFLLGVGVLSDQSIPIVPVPTSYQDAEELAARVRGRLDLGDGPVNDLGAAAERLGLLWYSEDLGEDAGDGACVEVTAPAGERIGVAVVNGVSEPGRRRWTLAHELGHFLMGDAYAAEHPAGDTEQQINAFVAHLLMPRQGVESIWRELKDAGERRVALALAARYRTSWSAACNQLKNLDHLTAAARATCRRPTDQGGLRRSRRDMGRGALPALGSASLCGGGSRLVCLWRPHVVPNPGASTRNLVRRRPSFRPA